MHCLVPHKRRLEIGNDLISLGESAALAENSSSCSSVAPPTKVARLRGHCFPSAVQHGLASGQQPVIEFSALAVPASILLQQQSSLPTATSSPRKQQLLQLLRLVRFIKAAGEPLKAQTADDNHQQVPALPAALAAANSCLAAVHAAVSLVNSIVEQPHATADMTDRALRVAEAALAATQLNIAQAKKLALQQKANAAQQQQQGQTVCGNTYPSLEDEELRDTCCSRCRL